MPEELVLPPEESVIRRHLGVILELGGAGLIFAGVIFSHYPLGEAAVGVGAFATLYGLGTNHEARAATKL